MKKEVSGRKRNETKWSSLFGSLWKSDWQNKKIGYSEARKTSKHIILKSGAKTHIRIINMYMDYSYNYVIMTQDHDPHPFHTDVDGNGTFHRYQCHFFAWVPAHSSCRKHDFHGHSLSSNSQRQERWTPSLWIPTCLEQCQVDGTSHEGRPLQISPDLKTSDLGPSVKTVGRNYSPLVAVC